MNMVCVCVCVCVQDVYAIVTFKSESSAVSALQSPPLMGDKRLVVKPRDLKPRPRAGAAVMEVDEPRYSIPVSEEVMEHVRRADSVSVQHKLTCNQSLRTFLTPVTACEL